MTYDTERQLIELIATDRISIPIKSMAGKLDRQRPKLALDVDLDGKKYFQGERVYARVRDEDKMRARGMREGIEMFAREFPEHGAVLNTFIEYQRSIREKHLYFGVKDGCRITSEDYLGVMGSLGFTPATAERLYPELMDISRKLSRARQGEERSIIIG